MWDPHKEITTNVGISEDKAFINLQAIYYKTWNSIIGNLIVTN